MKFCTALNCMDGRVQLPVIIYLQKRFNVEYVDSITEAGPNLILAEQKNDIQIKAILDKLDISINQHKSIAVAVVCHHDCAGNPSSYDNQMVQLQKAIKFLRQQYNGIEIIGLWVDKNWKVHEVIPGNSNE